ncbi:MAG: nuclear transport factor 2 family protein [Pseudomonadales bacterium]|jgi:ketosteroid isomerase-like protein
MRDDQVAIEQLLNRYCHKLDQGDIDAVVALFADNAVLDPVYEGSGLHEGRAAIRAWYQRYGANTIAAVRGLRHKISTAMIDVDGDSATSVCYLDADSVSKDTGKRSLVGGRYEDRFVRTDAGWRLQHRRILIDYASTLG